MINVITQVIQSSSCISLSSTAGSGIESTIFLLDDSLWKKSWYANGFTPLALSDSRSSFFVAEIWNCLLYVFVSEHSPAVDDLKILFDGQVFFAFLIQNAEVGCVKSDLKNILFGVFLTNRSQRMFNQLNDSPPEFLDLFLTNNLKVS